ncbi:MAG: acetyl-CoA carboxylase carboxyltransferase subunit alpha [Bacteroidia bacterium]|nr:acetyl-CoA carboxylase carboxyltransferase subunit alpha [Bacteroidia bacterium]
MTYLDFEKPIQELENELNKLKEVQKKSKVPLDDKIEELNKLIENKIREIYSNLTAWQRVQVSRHPERPYTLAYAEYITNGTFMELHGDRCVADDKAMVGGFGKIEGQTFMIIGQQKGINTKMRQIRRFGMANPDGYRKALRLMKLAEKFNKPIVTFIDTPGAYPGLEAEERGQGEAIARNLYEMAQLKVPVICFIIGEGASGGALGIGVGDRVYMLENTWYSVISPESCSSILWRSWEHKEKAAEALKLTAKDMFEHGLIDGIIPEPLGGAHRNPQQAFENVKKVILESYQELKKIDPQTLVEKRIQKFVSMGEVEALDVNEIHNEILND